jgi:DNA-binding protein YbaB
MMEKFNQMKNAFALKKQMDEMKKKMEQIVVTVEEGQYEIVIRGDQTIESVREDGEDRNDLKKAFNKALKESQKVVSKKMRNQMPDFGMS